MRAVKVTAPGQAELFEGVPTPRLRPDYVLARPRAWIGVDWSGVVLDVGKNVTSFKPGDEVCGCCHGGNNDELEDGAFAEIVVCKEAATLHKPATWSFEGAATFGSAIYAVGQALVQIMDLGKKAGKVKQVFVYGGSSGTGTLSIQVAKL